MPQRIPSISRPPAPAHEQRSAHAPLLHQLGESLDDGVLERAMAQLQTGGDLPLLLATAKAMVRSGIAGVAARLIRSLGSPLTEAAEIREVLDQLDDMPSGEVPWATLADGAQTNLDALLEQRPVLRPMTTPLASVPSGPHLYRTATGNQHVIRDQPGGRLQLVFPFQDHRAHAAAAAMPAIEPGTTFLLSGVPTSALWERLRATRHENGYLPAIDLVESDLRVLAIWLHLVDVAAEIRAHRLSIFAGADAMSQYRAFLRECHWRQLPTATLRLPRPGWTPPSIDAGFFASIEAERRCRREELLRAQAEHYEARDAAALAHRFERAGVDEPPIRAIGFVTRYSTYIRHVMRDLAAAFARHGARLDIVAEPHDSAAVVDTWSALAGQPYDLAIVINHLRFELDGRIHPNLPFAGWIQDHMDALWSEQAGRSIGPCDLVLGQNAGEMCGRFGYPDGRFLVTSNLTDVETYSDEPLPEAELASYRCDISFVSHGSELVGELVERITAGGPEPVRAALHRFAALAAERLQSAPFLTYFDRLSMLVEAEASTGGTGMAPPDRGRALVPAIDRICDRLIRHQALGWTAAWAADRGRTLRIHGRGWDRHATLKAHAGGEIENGRELRAASQASSINLQVTGYASLHQRLLDSIMAGGFVLSRFSPRDFLNVPAPTIVDALTDETIRTIDDLASRRAENGALDAAARELERLGMASIDRADSPRRRREIKLLQFVGQADSDDAALLARLRWRCRRPDLAAGDMPGFAELTFDSSARLSVLLDHFVDDPAARRQAARPLREWVLRHATYDGLVDRMLEHLRAQLRRESRA